MLELQSGLPTMQVPLTPEVLDRLLQAGVGTLALVVVVLLLLVIAPVLYFAERRDQQRRKDAREEREEEKQLRLADQAIQRELVGQLAVSNRALEQQNLVLNKHTSLLETSNTLMNEMVGTNKQRITQNDDTRDKIISVLGMAASIPEAVETAKTEGVSEVKKAMDQRFEAQDKVLAQLADGLKEVRAEVAKHQEVGIATERKLDKLIELAERAQQVPPAAPEPKADAE